jgi:hypothetical protein
MLEGWDTPPLRVLAGYLPAVSFVLLVFTKLGTLARNPQ